MKRLISLTIVLSIFLFIFRFVYAGSVEVSQEFKKVAMTIAKEDFRDYIFKRIQTNDPCLGIAIYDLLGKLIYSDEYDDLSCMIVESYVDYVFLLKIKSQVDKLLEEKIKEGGEFEGRKSATEDTEWRQNEKQVANKIDLSTGTITRDNFLSFSALYWYTLSRKQAGLPISPYLLDLIGKNKGKFDALIIFKDKKSNQIWKSQVIRRLIKIKYDEGIDVRYPELIKYVLKELLQFHEGWETRIRRAYEDFYNIIDAENKNENTSENTANKSILEPINDNTPIKKITEILGDNFKGIADKEELSVKNEGAKFLSIVSSDTLGMFDKPNESFRIINTERFVNDVFGLFESIESQRSKKGFGFAVGLWYGIFFSGQEWINEDRTKLEYPVQSFRLNDRLQYVFIANDQYRMFVYSGGLVDMLTSNMLNKENKKFFYFGIGVKPEIFGNLVLCYSMAIPTTYSQNNVVGSVISV